MSYARVRIDIACNDPDNGNFAHRAEQLQIPTWDREVIEFECIRRRAPRFTETAVGFRLLRREWATLASKEWYGNWCWNAYWLAPDAVVQLLAVIHKSQIFHLCSGPTQLYENWNEESCLDEQLWFANLWGRHSIGIIDAEASAA